jgi:hypothetical protein
MNKDREQGRKEQMSNSQHEAPHETARPTDDYVAAVVAVRPKVKELLEEYRADPTGDAGAILETLVVNQMAGAKAREAEVLLLHQERGRHHALASDLGRAAKRLERRNRQLQRELAKREAAQNHVREYLEEMGAAIASKDKEKELTYERIIEKVSAAIGIGGPLIPRVEKDYKG